MSSIFPLRIYGCKCNTAKFVDEMIEFNIFKALNVLKDFTDKISSICPFQINLENFNMFHSFQIICESNDTQLPK